MYLGNFQSILPPYRRKQAECLQWLSEAHKVAENSEHTEEDFLHLFQRVGCSEKQIAERYFFLPDVQSTNWDSQVIYPVKSESHGVSVHRRNKFFHKVASDLFEKIYTERQFPDDMIHVSCTGYVSPSAAQIIATKSPIKTTVTHSYHMGCYGAFPALRMASGFLSNESILGKRHDVDLVHTELCSLHLNPLDSSLEQLVIQSLFADGCIAYRMSTQKPKSGFKVLSLHEELIPNSASAMEWMVSDWGMKMTLSKDVPKIVGQHVKEFSEYWIATRGFNFANILKNALFAVHPGGPKIIDQVKQHLELREDQVRASRELLKKRGNMSSATLPHLWEDILNDPLIPSGTLVVSFAFGPGLTICGSLMEKL